MDHWIDKNLSKAKALNLSCEDCGRPRTFDQSKLLELRSQGLKTFRDIAPRLKCKSCSAKGGDGKNVTMKPVWG